MSVTGRQEVNASRHDPQPFLWINGEGALSLPLGSRAAELAFGLACLCCSVFKCSDRGRVVNGNLEENRLKNRARTAPSAALRSHNSPSRHCRQAIARPLQLRQKKGAARLPGNAVAGQDEDALLPTKAWGKLQFQEGKGNHNPRQMPFACGFESGLEDLPATALSFMLGQPDLQFLLPFRSPTESAPKLGPPCKRILGFTISGN